jgi:hypothetical protein
MSQVQVQAGFDFDLSLAAYGVGLARRKARFRLFSDFHKGQNPAGQYVITYSFWVIDYFLTRYRSECPGRLLSIDLIVSYEHILFVVSYMMKFRCPNHQSAT